MNHLLDKVLDGLMTRYSKRVPDVNAITDAMTREHIISAIDEIENDHIAFRTIGVPQLGIRSLEKIFLYYGYKKRDYYHFAEKKLNAYWYSPPSPSYPRIFISELRVDDLSVASRQLIKRYTSNVESDPVDSLDLSNAAEVDLFLHRNLWSAPSWSDYLTLAAESEYAAWAIFNGYYLNHFTISVHNLKEGYNTIPEFNTFLERNGFKLNDSGGKFKKSPDGLLLQSSTVARMIEATFADGDRHFIAGSYVEFAERRILPQYAELERAVVQRIHRREGFEAQNANRIFESTYSSQTRKTLL